MLNFREWLKESVDFASFTPQHIEQYIKHFACSDCGVNISNRFGGIGEYGYMLHDDTWKSLGSVPNNADGGKLLCIGCIEKRLGRELMPTDFQPQSYKMVGNSSNRLKNRLGI